MAPSETDRPETGKSALNEFDRIAASAVAHHTAGRLDEAIVGYQAALALSPAHPAVLHNLATIAASRADHTTAIDLFDRIIAANPHHVAAHYNRAAALHAMGRYTDAIASYRRTASLEPAHYDAHRNLGFLHLADGDRDRALDHFARTYELRRGDDHATIANKSLTHTTRAKLAHDADQFRYLATRHRDASRFELLAKSYEDVARDFASAPSPLTQAQRDFIGEDYNTAIAIFAAAEVVPPAVSPIASPEAVAASLAASGVAVLDGLLTEKAFERFRRHLLESTIWHDFSHIGGFVASYLEDGLASPLLLQIVDEFRRALPGLLADKPLVQAWAFKGLATSATVGLHADDASLSLNFWITPDSANRAPDQGGLVVYRTPPPGDWRITGYDSDKARIESFARDHRADAVTVPYACNRAVLFPSHLFHGSDRPDFAPGHENHRINVTLLFGSPAD